MAFKQQRVVDAFGAYESLRHVEIPEVVGAPHSFGYRNQAKLVVRRAGRNLLLGIYRPGTHQVSDISECPVHHPLIRDVLTRLGAVLDDHKVLAYDERTRHGWLRYVVVRAATWSKSVQVILVSAERTIPQGRQLARAIAALPRVTGVVQNINDDPGNVILGREYVQLAGEPTLTERVGSFKFITNPGAFLQANVPVARRLYETAAKWAAPDAESAAIDLYCGVGGLSFQLAITAKRVFAIEASPVAVQDAKRNTKLNGFHNVRFYCGDVGVELPKLLDLLGSVDIITLNPPRKGADERTREAILRAEPKRIAYVSCDPTTLARDLDWFAQHGYRTANLLPFDLLPQTEHVECVAALERG